MDTVEMTLLLDYYGELLTPRQRQCVDLRYNQDYSLGEIAEQLGISRQGVYDNLSGAEKRLRGMEDKTGCVRRALACRRAGERIALDARKLLDDPGADVAALAADILASVRELKE